MGKTAAPLDFDLLPKLDTCPTRWAVPDDLHAALSRFPETAARCEAVYRFCWLASVNNEGLPIFGPEEVKAREAFLRAALSELVSMSEMAKEEAGISLQQSPNPLVRFTSLLRHANVHLRSGRVVHTEVQAVWPKPESEGGNVGFSLKIWILNSDSLDDALKTDAAGHYHPAELKRIRHWVENAQSSWGTADLVRRAAELFAEEILHRSQK